MKAINRVSAVFFTAIGIIVPATWTALFLTGSLSSFMQRPVEAFFHLVADTLLSVSCLAAAAGLIKDTRWARRLLCGSCGLLIAALINIGSFYLFNAGSKNHITAAILAFLLVLALVVFIPHYRQSIRETGGAGGMFLLSSGMLVYLLITAAGRCGQQCLDESGVYAGAFFLMILGTLLLSRFLLYTIFRGIPYISDGG